MTTGEIILQQFGGGRFIDMTGAHSFVILEDGLDEGVAMFEPDCYSE
jgi:hypothetical protein